MKQNSRLGFRSLFAAATLLAVVSPSVRASELNFTADDLGAGRFVVDLYTAADIGLGAGTWTYGNRPVTPPVLSRSLSASSQSGSINFLNYRNSALVTSAAGVSAIIYGNVYQSGLGIDDLLGAAIFGAVVIPNVSVGINNVGSIVSYNLYNPNSYTSVLNVTNSTVTGTPGRDAIHADAFVDLTLNLSGNNRINGATLATQIIVLTGSTTFNGNVAGAMYLLPYASLNFTGQAAQIYGDITELGSFVSSVSFAGGNTVNGDISMNRSNGSVIDINGSGVVFNGASVTVNRINFTTGGSLALSNGVQVDANIDFQGNNATLTIGNGSSVSGSLATNGQNSGSVVFSGSGRVGGFAGQFGSFRDVTLQGGGSSVAFIDGYAKAITVNLNASGVAAFGGGLDTRLADGTLGTIKFFNSDGKVQIGLAHPSGTISSTDVFGNFVTDTNNNGVLTMVGGTQTVTGQIGAALKSLRLLNIGSANTGIGNDTDASSLSRTTIDGDVYAQTVAIYSGASYSELTMAADRNITGTSLTNTDSLGYLRLNAGTQAATFATIGTASHRLWALYSGLNAPDISTITGLTYLTVGLTGAGRTDYNNTLDTSQYELQAGTANFNIVDGTTRIGTLNFDFNGTANFHQGLTGYIDFQGHAGTVNIAAGKDFVGDVIGPSAGSLNFAGGSSQLTGSVNGINTLSVGSAGSGVGASSQATLTVTGDITATTVSLANNSTLIAQGDITANVTTTTTGTGVLTLTSGDQTVSGSIGSSAARLASAPVGATGQTTTLNGTVPTAGVSCINQVTFAGNGALVLNGANGGAAVSGLIGAVDFTSGGTGSLVIGSGVNLTFGATGITLQNANLAHLAFLGDSTVTGQIGAAAVGLAPATSTPRDVYAGANGSVVNFGGKVFVSATTFHVVGTGTVNFADDLVGPLVYEANGTVNFNDTKRVVGVVTTTADDQGILNYKGSTVLAGQIGTSADRLKSVNFHTDTTQASSSQSLGYNIYAVDTNIGNTGVVSGSATTTVASIDANIHLGTNVTLADASTTLNTSGAQTLVGGTSVDFVHTKNADGTLSIGTVTQSTYDNILTTNNGTLGFAISASPFSTLGGSNGLINSDSTKSSRITTNGGSLSMAGAEKVQVSFLGSLKDNVSYALIVTDGGPTGAQSGTLLDNSFTIDTTMARNGGDLVLTTHRDAQTYITKSASLGSRGDALALHLGTLAAAGTGYSASLQTVFDKLDLDQWGYGNNAANLARQLQLLTPAGDGAAVQASLGITSQAIGTVLDGSSDLSTKVAPGNDYWVRAFGGRLSRTNSGEYAGFSSNAGGAVVGTDRAVGSGVIGLALGYGQATATSDGIRSGDKADVKSTFAGVYFRAPVGKFFLNGIVDVAQHSTTTDRQTAVGERAQGDYKGTEVGGSLQFGRKFELANKDASLTPVLAVDYARYHQAAYAETGAGDIALNVGAQTYSQSAASLALRFAKENKISEDKATSFNAYLGYKHLLSTPTYNSDVSFVGDSQSFSVAGWHETHKGSVTGGLSYNYNPRKGVTYSLQYDGEVKSSFSQHTLGVRATWSY
ncbi:MAG: autotransporter domain-containing protein [Opitutales bacterium]|nr:autotransporter domain-containing protein [Opitutales bacterium]